MDIKKNRSLAIAVYSFFSVFFMVFLIFHITSFITWSYGLLFIYFMSMTTVFILATISSIRHLILVFRRELTIEQRIAMLENMIYDPEN